MNPLGPLLTQLRTVCMAYSDCLPTLVDPLAERARFSQVQAAIDALSERGPGLREDGGRPGGPRPGQRYRCVKKSQARSGFAMDSPKCAVIQVRKIISLRLYHRSQL